jgi:DNA polymerase-3 subunit gamma/tau
VRPVIDAATHTQVDNIREVIVEGLSMMPVRDRYKVFIIDEVHQLSSHSFNALLKSIEEPPPHVAFIMATTAPDKIPDTILSRSQVFEFKTIASSSIAEQLRKIAKADGLTVSNEAIALVARSAEGSMRDAETAFDQVIAFAGTTVTVEDVALVLGLVGRDLLLDVMTAVADENGVAAFDLAGRAVEAGYDLKLLCRELARLVRDLLVLKVDPTRVTDEDIAPEGDRDRLQTLLPRYSREDLLRAFDVLTRAEIGQISIGAEGNGTSRSRGSDSIGESQRS